MCDSVVLRERPQTGIQLKPFHVFVDFGLRPMMLIFGFDNNGIIDGMPQYVLCRT